MASVKKEVKVVSKKTIIKKAVSKKKEPKKLNVALSLIIPAELESAIIKYGKINNLNKSSVMRMAISRFLSE